MWMTTAKVDTEPVEAGAPGGCPLHTPVVHEEPSVESVEDELERFQEEIRTLMCSDVDPAGPAEVITLRAPPETRACCYFTELLGFVSRQGMMTTGSADAVPVSPMTPPMPPSALTPMFSPSPAAATSLLPSGTLRYSVFPPAESSEIDEKELGEAAATVNPAGAYCRSDQLREQAPAPAAQQKRSGKRKAKGNLPPSACTAGKKSKAAPTGRRQKSSGKEEEAAAAAGDGEGGGEWGTEPKEKLPLAYVHVRARRGQATDRHSLAERARREKINARMKLLQDLVPGCNKISGTAQVLEEIINHVQTLQRQVEILSMRLATVNPRAVDLSVLDSFLDAADALAMIDVPPDDAWGSGVPATLGRQVCGWQHQLEGGHTVIPPLHQDQHLQQMRQRLASPSEWGRREGGVQQYRGHHHHHYFPLLHSHGLAYESSNPVALQPNRVKTEL